MPGFPRRIDPTYRAGGADLQAPSIARHGQPGREHRRRIDAGASLQAARPPAVAADSVRGTSSRGFRP